MMHQEAHSINSAVFLPQIYLSLIIKIIEQTKIGGILQNN